MKYNHVLSAFYSSVWAILPEKLEEIRAFLHLKAEGDVPEEEIQAVIRRPAAYTKRGRVGILPIQGVISQRVGLMERSSGGISTEEIGWALDELTKDPAVRAIVLAIDSPGGSVFGVKELADKIRYYRTNGKRIVAVADSIAASAAYWLASQAGELVVTPGGQVGSIGVIAAHVDVSKMEESLGVKTTYVTSSKYKAETAQEAPLSEEARGELQAKVDSYHAMFAGAVAKGRRTDVETVNGKFGQGRMVLAQEAVKRGMADRVATMEQVLADLGAGGTSAGAAAARARVVEIS